MVIICNSWTPKEERNVHLRSIAFERNRCSIYSSFPVCQVTTNTTLITRIRNIVWNLGRATITHQELHVGGGVVVVRRRVGASLSCHTLGWSLYTRQLMRGVEDFTHTHTDREKGEGRVG